MRRAAVRWHRAHLGGSHWCCEAAAAPSADLSAYTVLTDLGYERGPAAKPLARLYASLLDNNVRAVRILGATVLNLCYVASCRASSMVIGLVERDCPKPWDWCAGTCCTSCQVTRCTDAEAGANHRKIGKGYATNICHRWTCIWGNSDIR